MLVKLNGKYRDISSYIDNSDVTIIEFESKTYLDSILVNKDLTLKKKQKSKKK